MNVMQEASWVLRSGEDMENGKPRWVMRVDHPAMFGGSGVFQIELSLGPRLTIAAHELEALGRALMMLAKQYQTGGLGA